MGIYTYEVCWCQRANCPASVNVCSAAEDYEVLRMIPPSEPGFLFPGRLWCKAWTAIPSSKHVCLQVTVVNWSGVFPVNQWSGSSPTGMVLTGGVGAVGAALSSPNGLCP